MLEAGTLCVGGGALSVQNLWGSILYGRLRRRFFTIQDPVIRPAGQSQLLLGQRRRQLLPKDNVPERSVSGLGLIPHGIPATVRLRVLCPLGVSRRRMLANIGMVPAIEAMYVRTVVILHILKPARASGATPGWRLVGKELGQDCLLKNFIVISFDGGRRFGTGADLWKYHRYGDRQTGLSRGDWVKMVRSPGETPDDPDDGNSS